VDSLQLALIFLML